MSISLATMGRLWPQAAIIREQFDNITCTVEDPLEITVSLELIGDGGYRMTCTTCSTTAVTIYKKRNKTIKITVTGPGDISGSKVWFSVKRDSDDLDTSAIISKKNLANGGSEAQASIIDGPNGVIEIYIDPSDTENIESGDYRYDVAIETVAGRKMEIVSPSRFTIEQPVTLT